LKPGLREKLEALQRSTQLYLAAMYSGIKAWTLTAWELERLAEEKLPDRYMKTVYTLRRNLYTYIASLGAEWPHEDENTILLPGTYVEAAKALKALWLSLHLVHLAPAEQPRQYPPLEEVYPIYAAYNRLRKTITRSKPIPFKTADRLLEAAAHVALLSGIVEPSHFSILGLEEPTADIIWALAKATVG